MDWKILDNKELETILTVWQRYIEKEFFQLHEEYNRRKWSIASIYNLYKIFANVHNAKFLIGINPEKEGLESFVAIALCAMRYNCFAEKRFRPHVYLWYILKNPLSGIKGVTKNLIEYISNGNNYVWLHAAPEGSEKLVQLYKSIGFKHCNAKKGIPLRFVRINDGRYMYLLKKDPYEQS